ncbi:hypothetical protein ACQZ4Y_19925 [Rhizobium sp. L80/93]|uniref:hypothetical protein n=1 Tax=Rhizobium sp. E27B/91 TaxID=2819995 RepID=UPI001ADAB1C0|nr:hypothetical protein [Rhizobium sp. E27B/91]MBO9188054.1 hypothetical protein [Rhizobium sp. E27B/91]
MIPEESSEIDLFSSLGVLIIAVGASRYIKQAEVLLLSLKRHMPHLKLAVVTDSDALRHLADVLLPVDRSFPISTAQKIIIDRYSPFSETLFIDSDCVVTRSFNDELEEIRKFEFTPVLERWVYPNQSDQYVVDLRSTLRMIEGDRFAKFNGGIYYFRRSPTALRVFDVARHYYRNSEILGILPFDKGGPGDETVLALAMAHCGVTDLYDDGGRLMRTPLGIRGRFFIDPLGGGTRFEKYGRVVEPAICHFAGHYILGSEYLLTETSLRSKVPIEHLGLKVRLGARLISRMKRLERFYRYKVDGLKKRMRRFNSFAFKSNA